MQSTHPVWRLTITAACARLPGRSNHDLCGEFSWLPHALQSLCPSCTRQASPITQKGFRANLSRPLQPRYRQQQPAAQIRTKYSTPNTTMVTISCGGGAAEPPRGCGSGGVAWLSGRHWGQPLERAGVGVPSEVHSGLGRPLCH